jgi:hypothetical protein
MLDAAQLIDRLVENQWTAGKLDRNNTPDQLTFYYKDSLRCFFRPADFDNPEFNQRLTIHLLKDNRRLPFSNYLLGCIYQFPVGTYTWRYRQKNNSAVNWSVRPANIETETLLQSFKLQAEMEKLIND